LTAQRPGGYPGAPAPFREVVSLDEALRRVHSVLAESAPGSSRPRSPTESVPLREAAGRVLARPVAAAEDVPSFDRSAVDGYAVAAADTFGAGEAAPVLLPVAGSVEMGQPAGLSLGPGQAAAVPTGGALPDGADAVVMVEHTTRPDAGLIEVLRPVAPGENVVRAGEDVARGTEILPAGRRLRPPDIGLLAAVGATRVFCHRRPRVTVIPTGDEIVPPDAPRCGPGQVRDITSAALVSYIERDGGSPTVAPVVRDRVDAFAEALAGALAASDLVLLLGGSSVGLRDHTAAVIDRFGPPGVVFHGLALKPGKPTVFGLCHNRSPGQGRSSEPDRPDAGPVPVFGLPGHPVSALVVYRLLVRAAVRLAGGEASATPLRTPEPKLTARLSRPVSSDQGREEYVAVELGPDPTAGLSGAGGAAVEVRLQATPVFGKSGLITMLTRADGLIRLPAGVRGLEAGTMVEVIPLA